MGNHEYCTECGLNDFHYGEPCPPEAKAKYQTEIRRLKERQEKATSKAVKFIKFLNSRYGLEANFDGNYVKIHFWEFENYKEKTMAEDSTFVEDLQEENKELKRLLALMYDRWENGVYSYEDPEDYTGYLGKAFKITTEEADQILAALKEKPMNFEDHAKEILALAWARFDTPLWSARFDMAKYLRKHFVLNQEGPQVCTREHLCRINGPCNGYPRT